MDESNSVNDIANKKTTVIKNLEIPSTSKVELQNDVNDNLVTYDVAPFVTEAVEITQDENEETSDGK